MIDKFNNSLRRLTASLLLAVSFAAPLPIRTNAAAKEIGSRIDRLPINKTIDNVAAKRSLPEMPLYFEEINSTNASETRYMLRGRDFVFDVSAAHAAWRLNEAQPADQKAENTLNNRIASCYEIGKPVEDVAKSANPLLIAPAPQLVVAAPPDAAANNEKPLTEIEKQKQMQQCFERLTKDASENKFAKNDLPAAETIEMQLVDANENARISGVEELPGKVNRYQGDDKSKWQTGAKTFAKVRAREVYSGIDAIYHTGGGALEYDFVVAPDQDSDQIKLEFSGADKVEIDPENGDLILKIGAREMRQQKPVIYQETGGVKTFVAGNFWLAGKNTVKFQIGDYDRSKTLVIDPTVVFATYIGGSGTDNVFQSFDSQGNTVGYGFVNSPGAVVGGAGARPAAGNNDFYIFKLNPNGQLIFATYYGGAAAENGNAGSINPFAANGLDSDILVTGTTDSANLPTTPGAGQTAHGGGTDGFAARININSGALVFSTYLGGSANELVYSANLNFLQTIDANNIYLVGSTPSPNFPLVNPVQAVYGGGINDNYLTKLNLNTGAFGFSTYIGGTGQDNVNLATVDQANNAILQGTISAPGANGFRVPPSAFQPTYGGGETDLLFAKISAAGALAAATYFGGNNQELGNPAFSTEFIGTQTSKLLVYGTTRSNNFPLVNAAQTGFGGGDYDGFVVSINTGNLTPVYSTYIGGAGGGGFTLGDIFYTLPIFDEALNDYGLIVYGTISQPDATPANNFPVVNQVQNGYGGGGTDVAAMRLNPNGSVGFSTYIGGSGDESTPSISFDSGNGFALRDVIFTGRITAPDATPNDNFTATANAAQTVYGGGAADIYFVRYDAASQPSGATYLGGSDNEIGVNVSIDNTVSPTRIYLLGATASPNFPLANAAQTVYGGGSQDLYVARLNPNASLIFSTFLGGSGADSGALNSNIYRFLNGSTVVSGVVTPGTSFPVSTNAVQKGFGGGTSDNFITKLSPTGAAEISTFIGGVGNETGNLSATFNPAGDMFFSNSITAPDQTPVDNFTATQNAGQRVYGGGTSDGFAVLYNADNSLRYATFVGGAGNEAGGAAFYNFAQIFSGTTTANGFPTTANAIQTTFGGGANDFVLTKINQADGSFAYSTLLGGNGDESGFATPDAAGNLFVSGTTTSTNLPVLEAFQTGYSVGGNNFGDNFFAKINRAGSLNYLSYLGGTNTGAAFAFDNTRFRFIRGQVYITGAITAPDQTPADNFQTVNAAQPNFGGGASDLVVIKLDDRFATAASANNLSDFDGDGRTDPAMFRPSNGVWYVQPSGGGNAPATATIRQQGANGFYGVQWGASGDKLAPADYDGDGKTDFAVWRDEPSNPDRANFYILNSGNNTVRAEQFGRTGDDPRFAGDWDGDGRADLAVYRNGASNGQSAFYYRPSSQTGTDFVAIPWGIAGDEPVRGDFDGDGKLDAAVFRPSNNVWYILNSSNNAVRYANWGVASDKRLSGDFDGDGRTDLTVFRSGTWYVLQSSTNQPIYRQWGLASDKLVAGDYDGDGRTDFAVWRDGVFYVLNAASNQFQPFYFGSNGDLPIAGAGVL